MYWTDWGTPASIHRASMDGSNHTVLHDTNLLWPNALCMDYDNQTLYWFDAAMDKIESSNVDGSGRRLLSQTHIYHPFSCDFLDNTLFWSDWTVKAVLDAKLNNLSTVYITIGNLTNDPMGVRTACAVRQQNSKHIGCISLSICCCCYAHCLGTLGVYDYMNPL